MFVDVMILEQHVLGICHSFYGRTEKYLWIKNIMPETISCYNSLITRLTVFVTVCIKKRLIKIKICIQLSKYKSHNICQQKYYSSVFRIRKFSFHRVFGKGLW
uniref:Uncharacterized protein n=1 Tax=Cacopsylla melanoneura TaxID=428564 RepID=A0A8D8UEA3_9HEMI